MSNEGAGGTSGSVIAWSGTATGHAGSPGPSGSVWNGMTQRHGRRDSSSSGWCADDWLVRADSGSTQPSTHQTALTVTASNTAMVHALTTGHYTRLKGPLLRPIWRIGPKTGILNLSACTSPAHRRPYYRLPAAHVGSGRPARAAAVQC